MPISLNMGIVFCSYNFKVLVLATRCVATYSFPCCRPYYHSDPPVTENQRPVTHPVFFAQNKVKPCSLCTSCKIQTHVCRICKEIWPCYLAALESLSYIRTTKTRAHFNRNICQVNPWL